MKYRQSNFARKLRKDKEFWAARVKEHVRLGTHYRQLSLAAAEAEDVDSAEVRRLEAARQDMLLEQACQAWEDTNNAIKALKRELS